MGYKTMLRTKRADFLVCTHDCDILGYLQTFVADEVIFQMNLLGGAKRDDSLEAAAVAPPCPFNSWLYVTVLTDCPSSIGPWCVAGTDTDCLTFVFRKMAWGIDWNSAPRLHSPTLRLKLHWTHALDVWVSNHVASNGCYCIHDPVSTRRSPLIDAVFRRDSFSSVTGH